jgi:hypothetical protein
MIRRLVLAAVALVVAAGLKRNWPDLARYQRMRRM